MKKILQLIIPAFLGMLPASGAENAGLIDDPAFSKNSIVSLRTVVENGDKVCAIVDATTQNHGTKTKIVEALQTPLGWEMNDQELYGCQKIKAQVVCGASLLAQEYTKNERKPYSLIKESEENYLSGQPVADIDLPFGKTVQVYSIKHYQRPDGTQYEKTIFNSFGNSHECIIQALYNQREIKTNEELFQLPANALVEVVKKDIKRNQQIDEDSSALIYHLVVKATEVSKGILYKCYEHKDEVCGQGFKITKKFRHWYEHYNTREVTRENFKRSLAGQETSFLKGQPMLFAKKVGRDSGRTNHPECASLPAGTQIVFEFPA